ncbi:WD40 repeat-like protein [Echria macrotheca]|uniref:WD40 repeat-like protein n=1 Tax=Echria macrotheca TaxID=438768 RepID=A0AAJ0F2L3_9PEZI|nr:WD40 repeat-like protein [Echria macrotheca]
MAASAMFLRGVVLLLSLLIQTCLAEVGLSFVVAGGQIFTPGLAILDAPQPGTPLGGELIEVALDVSTNGRMPLPPYPDDSPSKIHNITIFLYSYDTGRNFTITNGTASANNASLGDIMFQEPGSTVKHVKWIWPDCLVGDGQPTELGSARGVYNISIRQNFRLNGQDHYTIFDVPISVTNKIDSNTARPSCDSLLNPMLTPEQVNVTGANNVPVMFAPGDATVIQTSAGGANNGDGLGPTKPGATPGQGLGNGAGPVRIGNQMGCWWKQFEETNKLCTSAATMSSRHQNRAESPEDLFGGFDDDEENAVASAGMESSGGEEDDEEDDDVQVKLDSMALDEKDSDEEDLERFVLGNKDSFRNQLFRDDLLDDSAILGEPSGLEGSKTSTGKEGLDASAVFMIDTGKSNAEKQLVPTEPAEDLPEEDAPAWVDSDDERLTVSLAKATRLRKLRTTEAEDVVSGTEYSRRLRQQYLRLYPLPDWAKHAAASETQSKSRRRRSSASQGGSSGSSGESDDEEIESALPLDTFLRDANSFNSSGARKRRKLRPETIDIQRSRDLPDVHKAAVSSLSFHPRHPIVLSSSTSSILYLHHYDPAAYPTPNPALTSVQVQRTDLRRTAFLGPNGDEIVFAGRRRYFHSWNLSTGVVRRVTQIQGHQKEQRTMEHFRLSPCGRYMALVSSARKGGGMLNILSVATMQWIAQARPNGRHGIADFAWWANGEGLTIAGRDGQVTEWSMAAQRTIGVWRDEGSIGGTVLAMGGHGGPKELGGDRWVAIGSTSGILNIYDRNQLIAPAAKGKGALSGADTEKAVEINTLPEPTRAFEQLTTTVTVVSFSPDGQLLAFGSALKKDALRLVHLPSCTVYRNWPTDQTPLGRVSAVAFDAKSELLAVGNDQGKAAIETFIAGDMSQNFVGSHCFFLDQTSPLPSDMANACLNIADVSPIEASLTPSALQHPHPVNGSREATMPSPLLSEKRHFGSPDQGYSRDFPIIVHTLVEGGVHRDLYLVNTFLDTALPHDNVKLRWLHVPGHSEREVEVVATFNHVPKTAC